ncbi:MAG TPA: hypothetical protein PLI27_07115 [Ignavibacteriales bacterium]|nr:hypothetical protein [Ignavibacteriales bacterium]HOL81550.1 hypothetical protein [Ignavibacteriales bacterium]HOM65620.1 hypothetical protein [Ignavibacteriales bacterium]HPD67828.1 hypothetical protein [Ignavibacteriales bacterium]HPP33664.1 hypothetical protein [Ignavibacteriales bacterium]
MNNDLFIKYYDNQLSSTEKENFEKLLATDPLTKKAYEDFLTKQNSLKELNKIQLNQEYFVNLPVKINQRISSKNKPTFITKTALAFSLTSIIIFLFIWNFWSNPTTTLNNSGKPFIAETVKTNTNNFSENIQKSENKISVSKNVAKDKLITYSSIENESIELEDNDIDDFINTYQSYKIIKTGR